MKRFFLLFAISVLAFASCKSSEDEGGNSEASAATVISDYLNPLPEDAELAFKLSVQQLFDDASLYDNDCFLSFKSEMVESLESESASPEYIERMKEIFDDLSASGIDFRQPAVMAGSLGGDDAVLICAIADYDKLCNLIEMSKSELDADEEIKVMDADSCKYGVLGGTAFAFNHRSFVVSLTEDNTDRVLSLIAQNKIMCEKGGFVDFLADPSQAVMWAEFKPLWKQISKDAPDEVKKFVTKDDLKVANIIMRLTSDDDLVATLSINGLSKLDGLVARHLSRTDDKLFGHLPGNCIAAANLSISDIPGLIDAVQKGASKELEEVLSSQGISFSDITGDIAAAVTDLNGADTPDMVLAVGASRKVYDLLEQFSDFAGISLSYSEGVITGVTGGRTSGNFSASPLAGLVKNGGVAVDLQKLDVEALCMEELDNLNDPDDVKALRAVISSGVLKKFGTLSLTGEKNTYEIRLASSDGSKLLKAVVDICTEFAMAQRGEKPILSAADAEAEYGLYDDEASDLDFE